MSAAHHGDEVVFLAEDLLKHNALPRQTGTFTVWSRFGAAPVPSITVACTNANDVGLPLSFCCTVRAETRTATTTTAAQAIDKRITTPSEAVNDRGTEGES